jgi:hypothetical protein
MRIREARRRGDADETVGQMSGMIGMSLFDTSESADQLELGIADKQNLSAQREYLGSRGLVRPLIMD